PSVRVLHLDAQATGAQPQTDLDRRAGVEQRVGDELARQQRRDLAQVSALPPGEDAGDEGPRASDAAGVGGQRHGRLDSAHGPKRTGRWARRRYDRPTNTVLSSVNASMAGHPPSRPRPDVLKPPNGVLGATP